MTVNLAGNRFDFLKKILAKDDYFFKEKNLKINLNNLYIQKLVKSESYEDGIFEGMTK